MNLKKLSLITVILIFLAVLFVVYQNNTRTVNQTSPLTNSTQPTFLIDGFPLDQVPLYKLSKVSSNKIFINTDPKNLSEFSETNFAYFNVVFYSDAGQEEFLNYYKNLFDTPIVDEYGSPDMVKGVIGPYKVSAAHYGSDNTAYLQVHLANFQDESLNQYFLDFPQILESSSNLIEHEKSYGLLNQKGGEIEYTKYYTVIDSGDQDNDGKDDVDEFQTLEDEYQTQFQTKPEYSYDPQSGIMKWKDGDFSSTLSISRDHGRIYLMLRKNI